jgi:hypothetical protein
MVNTAKLSTQRARPGAASTPLSNAIFGSGGIDASEAGARTGCRSLVIALKRRRSLCCRQCSTPPGERESADELSCSGAISCRLRTPGAHRQMRRLLLIRLVASQFSLWLACGRATRVARRRPLSIPDRIITTTSPPAENSGVLIAALRYVARRPSPFAAASVMRGSPHPCGVALLERGV